MIIHKASYGGVDCTEIIKSKISGNKLIIRSDNSIIGDTNVGQVKYLEIEGEWEGQPFKESVREGTLLSFPKSKVNRLGIFYSNNINEKIYPAISKSLDTIRIASEGKADIVTCMWRPMPGNPFPQMISWYQSQSHLNQLLQILQCLYSAKEMSDYEYVSFLEHDVLYPEGYFDFPHFERGKILTNMNYGGINREGWQLRGQDDEPFHQMTMRFDDAIQHCLEILPNALRTNSGNIESQTFERTQWRCEKEAIHINHGVHFTSHNSIYRKDNTYKTHPYWGEHSHYLNLFE
jgi:hypothetical protein